MSIEDKKEGKIRRDELKNVVKIVKCLQEAKDTWLWYREIGRRCRMDHKTVSRLIDKYLRQTVEVQEGVPPFMKIKMVRIKPGESIRTILRYLSVKQKIESVRNSL
ncbi:MAG: hypothetical protein HYT70_01325 [Candidatus Aenigmarchaeota archaeon]|nr:hypothetical protein [Candidatus Aenigmarchaeota archaeon]